MALELAERYPPNPDAPRGLAYVLRTGQPDVEYDFTDEMLDAMAVEPEQARLVRELGLRAWIVVPILAGDQVLGAISMIGAESDRQFGPDDLAFAENLAARVAVAIQNARAFREAVRYKRVLDATLDAVIVFDPASLRISYVNQGAMDQLGYAEADLVGADATMVVEDIDAIGLRGLVAPLVTGALDAQTATLSYRHSRGRSVPVEVLLQHVVPAGEAGRIVAVARDIRDRIEAQATPPAARRVGARPGGRAERRHPGDGRRHLRLRPRTAGSSSPTRPPRTCSPTSTSRRTPRSSPSSTTRTGSRRRSARAAGRSSCALAASRSAGSSSSTYPVAVGPASRRRSGGRDDRRAARRHRGAPAAGRPRHVHRRPVARAADAGHDDLRAARRSWPATARRSTRRRSREIFDDIVVESERLHRLVEDVVALNRFGDEGGDVGAEPVLLQRILPSVVRSEEGRWPGVTFELDVPPGLPTVDRRPDLRRAGRPQPALECGEVRRHRHRRSRSRVEAATTRCSVRDPRRRAGLPAGRVASGSSSCSSARRGPRGRPPAPGSGCSSAPG